MASDTYRLPPSEPIEATTFENGDGLEFRLGSEHVEPPAVYNARLAAEAAEAAISGVLNDAKRVGDDEIAAYAQEGVAAIERALAGEIPDPAAAAKHARVIGSNIADMRTHFLGREPKIEELLQAA